AILEPWPRGANQAHDDGPKGAVDRPFCKTSLVQAGDRESQKLPSIVAPPGSTTRRAEGAAGFVGFLPSTTIVTPAASATPPTAHAAALIGTSALPLCSALYPSSVHVVLVGQPATTLL